MIMTLTIKEVLENEEFQHEFRRTKPAVRLAALAIGNAVAQMMKEQQRYPQPGSTQAMIAALTFTELRSILGRSVAQHLQYADQLGFVDFARIISEYNNIHVFHGWTPTDAVLWFIEELAIVPNLDLAVPDVKRMMPVDSNTPVIDMADARQPGKTAQVVADLRAGKDGSLFNALKLGVQQAKAMIADDKSKEEILVQTVVDAAFERTDGFSLYDVCVSVDLTISQGRVVSYRKFRAAIANLVVNGKQIVATDELATLQKLGLAELYTPGVRTFRVVAAPDYAFLSRDDVKLLIDEAFQTKAVFRLGELIERLADEGEESEASDGSLPSFAVIKAQFDEARRWEVRGANQETIEEGAYNFYSISEDEVEDDEDDEGPKKHKAVKATASKKSKPAKRVTKRKDEKDEW